MEKFDLKNYLELIQAHKASRLHVVPPVALALAKNPLCNNFDLSSVKVLFCGAAPLGASLEHEIITKYPNLKVKQAYGMTELSPATHIVPSYGIKSGSVGLLLPNQVAKIVSTLTGNVVGIMEHGEICIKGPNVMKGYLNNPEATKATVDSEGFLHTGDLGYVDKDGYYFIVDRVKELIKYKGNQVAPAELEELLLTHPAVADAAVVGIPDEEAGELPKAYVVGKPNHTCHPKELHDFLEDKIAPHKRMRGGIEFIQAIPKTASGKILRR